MGAIYTMYHFFLIYTLLIYISILHTVNYIENAQENTIELHFKQILLFFKSIINLIEAN